MGTLTALMSLSAQALQADQTALDVTSNNVANQNTVGYTRESVTFQTSDAVTVGGVIAGGVSTGAAPVSQRDRVLEQRVQQQTQAQAQSSAVETALQQVQSVFGLSSTATSASATALGTATDGFFSALSLLASNPADVATRQGVLSAANTLTSAFNSASSQMAQIVSGLDQQAKSDVGQVNTLTKSIATLNGQISSLSSNKDAGVLENQRQAAIAQLSQYIGLDQVSTEGNGISLTTSNGTLLVGGTSSYSLSLSEIGGTTHLLAGPSEQDITSSVTGGQLGGTLYARNQLLPSFNIALDTLANGIATQVNHQSTLGVDQYGSTGQQLFTIPSGIAGTSGIISVAINDPLKIAAAAIGQGSTGNTNAQLLATLGTANIVAGTTASGYYASLLGTIGSAAAGATTDNTTQQASLTQLTTQRDALSGVSLDQEAANLTQYQRSYEAAAKVFSVVDSIMASALNLGVTTSVA